VEFHARMQLESIRHQVGGDRPRLGEVAHDLGIFVQIEPEQRGIERR
jgi:hypothetical protein